MREKATESVNLHYCIWVYFSQGRGWRFQSVSANSGRLPQSQTAALDHFVVFHPSLLDFSAEEMGTWLKREAETRQEASKRVLVLIFRLIQITKIQYTLLPFGSIHSTDAYFQLSKTKLKTNMQHTYLLKCAWLHIITLAKSVVCFIWRLHQSFFDDVNLRDVHKHNYFNNHSSPLAFCACHFPMSEYASLSC